MCKRDGGTDLDGRGIIRVERRRKAERVEEGYRDGDEGKRVREKRGG